MATQKKIRLSDDQRSVLEFLASNSQPGSAIDALTVQRGVKAASMVVNCLKRLGFIESDGDGKLIYPLLKITDAGREAVQ